MSGARLSTLACLQGDIDRLETGMPDASGARRSAMPRRMLCCRAGWRAARCTKCFATAARRRRHRLCRGRGAAVRRNGFLLWVGRIFPRARRRTGDGGFRRTRPRSASHRGGARARRRGRVARVGRCARLQRARRGGHRIGGETRLRSGRQPQADARGEAVRRHRLDAAHRGHAAGLDRGDALGGARGAFAAAGRMGRAGARNFAHPQSSRPNRPLDHGMEL